MVFTCSECDSTFKTLDGSATVQCLECKSTFKRTGKDKYSYVPPNPPTYTHNALRSGSQYKKVTRIRLEKTPQQQGYSLFCLRCHRGISHIESTPVEVQTGQGKREVGRDIINGIEIPRYIYFPATTKGRVCPECLRDHISLSEILPEYFPVAVIDEKADHSTIGFGHTNDDELTYELRKQRKVTHKPER